MSLRNKVGRAHDRDALSCTIGLGRGQQRGVVLRRDRRGLARVIDLARHARQGTARTIEELVAKKKIPGFGALQLGIRA